MEGILMTHAITRTRLALLAALNVGTSASAFEFFESGIDYWSKPEAVRPATAPSSKSAVPPTSSQFDWNRQLDPKNDEFFREGDYVPPAPFLALVRNPSD